MTTIDISRESVQRLRTNMRIGHASTVDAERMIIALRAALDAAEARAVVKPLVWNKDPDNDGDSCFWRATAGDYIYEVGAELSYWWQLDGDISTCAIDGFTTPDLAQAAAQADYEARILSALHPASPLSAVAMREKAAALFTIPEAKPVADRIRAIPTTFTHADLLAAAGELDEVKALVNAATNMRDYGTVLADQKYHRDLDAAIAPFARKAGV